MCTITQLRDAATRCLVTPQSDNDAITARSLLDSIESGSTAENIEAADNWFNKPAPPLPEFMKRYGA